MMMQSDEPAVERAVQHLQKVIGVHDAAVVSPGDTVARELALVKLRPSSQQGRRRISPSSSRPACSLPYGWPARATKAT